MPYLGASPSRRLDVQYELRALPSMGPLAPNSFVALRLDPKVDRVADKLSAANSVAAHWVSLCSIATASKHFYLPYT